MYTLKQGCWVKRTEGHSSFYLRWWLTNKTESHLSESCVAISCIKTQMGRQTQSKQTECSTFTCPAKQLSNRAVYRLSNSILASLTKVNKHQVAFVSICSSSGGRSSGGRAGGPIIERVAGLIPLLLDGRFCSQLLQFSSKRVTFAHSHTFIHSQ